MRSIGRAALLVAAIPCAGCTVSTSTVRVRDTAPVALESTDGAALLPEGGSTARVASGSFWRPFQKVAYDVVGERASDGAITLRCDACETTSFPALAANGVTEPTWSWRVAIEPSRVVVSYEDECLERHRHFCEAALPVRLTVPSDDVVEVRRRIEPVRPLGYVYTAVSALALGALAVVAIRDHDAAPVAAAGAVPFLAFGGVGLWEILAPAKEEVWTPTPGAH
jgi:hypothetical protein